MNEVKYRKKCTNCNIEAMHDNAEYTRDGYGLAKTYGKKIRCTNCGHADKEAN